MLNDQVVPSARFILQRKKGLVPVIEKLSRSRRMDPVVGAYYVNAVMVMVAPGFPKVEVTLP
jgi:hypothetical protein